ncbi:MAG: response regulator [Patescibacteria group bacterium]|nr:response regulator [Patescibacteria group bacterium]
MPKRTNGGKKKILIVEDEKILGDILVKKFIGEGYDAAIARDGAEGLAMVKSYQPNLMLLDILMPKLDGYQVLEAMQKDGSIKNIAVIIISNSGQPVELERTRTLGAVDYLVKTSFTPDEVMEKVLKVFDPQPAKPTWASSKKILMVEDDKFLRDLAVKKITLAGYRIITAVDGNEAIEKVTQERPGLILLDIILPGMDGFEILRTIKANPQLKSIPVILLSNLGQESDIQRGLQLGAVDYLVKAHFTLEEIIEKIKQYLK